jgi:hypothetical protein
MALQTYSSNDSRGDHWTFVDNAAAATITITLPAPGAQRVWIIDSILTFALGTLTVIDVEVFKNDGTTKIARIGGQVNAADVNVSGGIPGPIVTASNDAPKVVWTATGATAVELTVNAHLGVGA